MTPTFTAISPAGQTMRAARSAREAKLAALAHIQATLRPDLSDAIIDQLWQSLARIGWTIKEGTTP